MRIRFPAALAGIGLMATVLTACTGGTPAPAPTFASPTATSAVLGAKLSAADATAALPDSAVLSGWQKTSGDEGVEELTSELGAVSFDPSSCDLATALQSDLPQDGVVTHVGEVFTGAGVSLPRYAAVDIRSYDHALDADAFTPLVSLVRSCPKVAVSAFGQTIDASLATVTPATSYGDETLGVRVDLGGSVGGSSNPLSGTLDLTVVRVGHTIVSVVSVGVEAPQTEAGQTLTAATMAGLQRVTAG